MMPLLIGVVLLPGELLRLLDNVRLTACAVVIHYDLDLVPPMPVDTLASSLTPERTIHRSVFSLFSCDDGSL